MNMSVASSAPFRKAISVFYLLATLILCTGGAFAEGDAAKLWLTMDDISAEISKLEQASRAVSGDPASYLEARSISILLEERKRQYKVQKLFESRFPRGAHPVDGFELAKAACIHVNERDEYYSDTASLERMDKAIGGYLVRVNGYVARGMRCGDCWYIVQGSHPNRNGWLSEIQRVDGKLEAESPTSVCSVGEGSVVFYFVEGEAIKETDRTQLERVRNTVDNSFLKPEAEHWGDEAASKRFRKVTIEGVVDGLRVLSPESEEEIDYSWGYPNYPKVFSLSDWAIIEVSSDEKARMR